MEKKYFYTIGLEIHAELKTNTKMFCGCKNDPDETKPNVNICPVCMAHPGALPVINKKAVENVIKVGLALNGNIADFTEFDRKNYFYPDIPKGYQISQYKYPIVSGGHLVGMDITRVHLEEDTANNKHRGEASLIDFNRAGIPLMELVTEPHTFESPEDTAKIATKFAKELQLILWYLGVSEANMEKGEMRVEANISVSLNKEKYGTKVEVKNLNSFRSVERAILYEIKRMTELHNSGKAGEIVQETRGWDESKQSTFSQRAKESSHDYRYFPDPDLPKLKLKDSKTGFDFQALRVKLPELPDKKRDRYKKSHLLKDEDIETFINNKYLCLYFDELAQKSKHPKSIQLAANYITSDFIGIKKNNTEATLPSINNFIELINLVDEGQISSRVAKDILAMIVIKDESPYKIATEKNLLQINDEVKIKEIVRVVIDANQKDAEDYKQGKKNAAMSIVGKVIKETKGTANPTIVQSSVISILEE